MIRFSNLRMNWANYAPKLDLQSLTAVTAGQCWRRQKGQNRQAVAALNPHTNFPSICTCSESSAKISVQHSQINQHSEKIGVGACKWTGDLKKLKVVHIDKSFKIKSPDSKKKKQTYAVFVIDFFNIIDLGDFGLDRPDLIYEAISKNIRNSSQDISDEIVERFSIVSYFLYRSKPSGLWLNISDGFDKKEILKFTI